MVFTIFLAGALAAAPSQAPPDPLAAPHELIEFVRRLAAPLADTKGRAGAIVGAFFRAEEDGGLGIAYDNGRTRTVAEVWRERKANCLSLTALAVASLEAVGIPAEFAEVTNAVRWRREGSLVHAQGHVVTLVRLSLFQEAVVDFSSQLRRRGGTYRLVGVSKAHARGLFHSNRTAELLVAGRLDEAHVQATHAVRADPTLATAWNALGVALKKAGQWEGAERAYRKALALDPRDGAVVGNLEALMRRLGREEEAAHFQQLGHELRQRDPYFHAFLAREAFERGDLEEALRRVEKAIDKSGAEPEFHLLQARIHQARGDSELAERALEKARSCAPERERASSQVARAQ